MTVRKSTRSEATVREVSALNATFLKAMPLPAIGQDDDKDARGRILVIGGSCAVPGAMALAGVAALRTGAGKLQLATVRDAAMGLGFAVPESLVVALPQTADGEIDAAAFSDPAGEHLRGYVTGADAVLVGPGMMSDTGALALLRAIIPSLGESTTLVLDGLACVALRHDSALLHDIADRVVLTPHAGEMASMLDIDRKEATGSPQRVVQRAVRELRATVALKGSETWIASTDGRCLLFRGGVVGLGTSGSGDTLAGIVAGLAARGASPLAAAAWGVWAHGMAGRALARRTATVGFLARELLGEVPRLVGR
ncbi:MAG TPA: NAD(P)H-hydrate dehydratase [Gemmatimonas sp.]|nr:NAD(P)H-hydrate dehydratase [Gemmatimonas sp.]